MEKVRQALADLDEEEKKEARLSAIGAEFQSKYRQAFAQRRPVDFSALDSERKTVNNERDSLDLVEESSESLTDKSTETLAASSGEAAKDTDLVEALEQVTLSEGKTCPSKDAAKDSPPRNPFSAPPSQKKPHYIEVLERSSANVTKPRFKPNQ